MKSFPHHYPVSAGAGTGDVVTLSAPGLPTLLSDSPVEFDGPGDHWSPESLLVAAIADCFVLTFRAIARARRLEWHSLHCDAVGVLDRGDHGPRFTQYRLQARLIVPAGSDLALARSLLEKAEHGCLVSNSVNGEVELDLEVVVGGPNGD